MKILFLSDNFPPESNAPATRLYEHAVRWVKAGHEVTVLTGAPNFPEGRVYEGYRNRWRQVEDMDGIRVVRGMTYITANEGFIRRTLDYLSFMVSAVFLAQLERRPDVVVATSPQFFCALGGWLVSVLMWRPFVFELRDLWPASIVAVGAMKRGAVIRLLERLELFLYRRARLIVTVTESFRKDLISRGIEAERIQVVLNGVDLDQYSPAPRDVELAQAHDLAGKFVIGYLGTHGLAHGLDRVLEAVAELEDRKDIVFLFVGGGAQREHLEDRVRQLGLDQVRLIPRQPKSMMPRLWSLCDVALIPLKDNPVFATVMPSKLFEAMGMGVPVIMSLPEGEATRLVNESGCGVCVAPEQPLALAEAIVQLADDRERLGELATASLVAAPGFSRDRQAHRMLEILWDVTCESASNTEP